MREIGQEFAHYKIESLLGRGGMGEVYRAFDTKLHRRVALKLLLTSGTASPEAKSDAVARIIREARAAAAVEHPNKVSIFELGEVAHAPRHPHPRPFQVAVLLLGGADHAGEVACDTRLFGHHESQPLPPAAHGT